jgi:beta-galactosidase
MFHLPAASLRVVTSLALALTTAAAEAATRPQAPRRVVSLDGTWQVAEGDIDRVPTAFDHTVTVPGLIDMARPVFTEIGVKSPRRKAFWYRRTFKVDGPIPDVALLKINKARYGTGVWLNGKPVGEHVPCFTPGYFDVKRNLETGGAENTLLVRVGADRESLPAGVPSGWDFEKYRYYPGIYDSVELILSGAPFIRNVQVVPDVDTRTVRAVVELDPGVNAAVATLAASVREARTGRAVGSTDRSTRPLPAGRVGKTEVCLSIPDARLWTPEDPFLYELSLATGADAVTVRFGMRSFRFDPASRRALLNGKPYYLRGTNVCIYRFFEDEQRGDKPWRAEWVDRLHRQFKSLHWNAIRYCIGFPPEIWYDIADEEGFLIQDEFPIWTLSNDPKKDPKAEYPRTSEIVPQYVEWMRERWNHPCVVIWDGQNESFSDETGPAIRAVRHLDLSNRPWENGWAEPQSPTDCVESHPYLFIRGWSGRRHFRLSELSSVSGIPSLNDRQKKLKVPIIINEYCWLWLNRDGTPTCLTDKVYESILGPNSTTAQRRSVHARYVAALTEFWRTHREAAGVLQFCGLGYSRAGDKPRPEGGATSDHFTDVETLTFEPLMAEYLEEAFSPVGLMLDVWADELPAGAKRPMEVVAINDLDTAWTGQVRLRVVTGDRVVSVLSQPCTIAPLGRSVVTLEATLPTEPGRYTLSAELVRGSEKPVRSRREVQVKAP